MGVLRAPSIAALCIVLILAWYAIGFHPSDSTEGLLTVGFLDVGQGDAIFIESPTGTRVLVDGGRDGAVLSALNTAMGFFDRHIDMVLATHPDLDHIGGLIDVLKHYTVHTIVMTENTSDSSAFAAFQDAVATEGAEVIFARRGQIYDLGDGLMGSTTLTILFPDHNPVGLETNTASIVARLVYGESEYVLTGDSPIAIEEHLVALDGDNLKSDVLKLGHHGSRTSTSEVFLEAVSPRAAVVSAGKDNEYGHPHKDVIDRLTLHGIPYKNTADEGSILFLSDGREIWVR